MRPSYGTDLAKALFETQNQAEKAIRLAISTAISSWIPEVSVQQINVLGENLDGKMTVELLLVFPDFTSETISVSTATLNPDGSITR
jgi:phage baseplate assembly protein W